MTADVETQACYSKRQIWLSVSIVTAETVFVTGQESKALTNLETQVFLSTAFE